MFASGRLVFRLKEVHITAITERLKHVQHRKLQSYVFQTSQIPLVGSTIGQLLEKQATEAADKTAVIVSHQNIRKTFSQLNRDVDHLAAGLLALGLKPGDRVGMWGPNSYEWVTTQLATAKVGMIMTTINPAYQAAEIEFALNQLQCSAVITEESFKTQDYYKIMCSVSPDLETFKSSRLSLKRLPHLKHLVLISDVAKPGSTTFKEMLNNASSKHNDQVRDISKKVQFDDAVNVQFTSGTTGKPKGATLSHFNIVNNAFYIGQRLGYSSQPPVICSPVPLYHCFGCVVGALSCLVHKGTFTIPSPSFNPVASMKAIQTERCNVFYGTPTMYIDFMNHPDFNSYDYSSLEIGVMSGATCPSETIKQAKLKMGVKDVFIPYGCTETSPVCTLTGPADSETKKLTTVGRPLDFIEVKVVNDEGKIVPINTKGEVCLRGHSTFLGYWEDPEKTREVLKADKWYYTGDLGTMDEEGFLYIVGRKKDILIRGGENIYPREIEEFLLGHPDILDIHVVGVPDERMGEEICAWVNLKRGANLTEEDLKKYCKGKISHFKIPKYVIYTDDFPKTVTGKIQKFRLKEMSVAKLNLKKT